MSVAARRSSAPLAAACVAGVLALAVGTSLLSLLLGTGAVSSDACAAPLTLAGEGAMAPGAAGDGAVAAGAAGGTIVGATEYGGPTDPGSGVIGASGANLLEHPDSYAELGGLTFQTATMLGGLPYMTPLRVTWGRRSAVAYKRDFGLGGGPIEGRPRAIDLWWEFAASLGIPAASGTWSGLVRIGRPPATGAGAILGQAADASAGSAGQPGAEASVACAPGGLQGVAVTAGPRAQLLPSGLAAAPAGAPPAVREIIAAGNQIVGWPYWYGGGHGLPLSQLSPVYDCSSSVEHLLYGARLLPVDFSGPSAELQSFGAPGPGRWVTLYANAGHVFMYVAGLRWDTADAAGPGDGSTGIGWHPLIRDAAGFVARHPLGL